MGSSKVSLEIIFEALQSDSFSFKLNSLNSTQTSDDGGQCCPNSVRIYCAVSVSHNLKFSVGKIFECLDFEFELDFDRQTQHSTSGQNPDSTVRRRLPDISLQCDVIVNR